VDDGFHEDVPCFDTVSHPLPKGGLQKPSLAGCLGLS
jgi:hypothetical protein